MLRAQNNALGRLSRQLRSAAGRFRRDENGAIALMVAGSVFSILLVIGGSVDVYRYEMLRKKAQNTLDRAVLAAAALDQKVTDGEKVVRSYMKSAGLELPPNTKFIECPTAGATTCCPLEASTNREECEEDWDSYRDSFRSMNVTAVYEMDMAFLWLAGQKEWDVPVRASAVERERKIEISLVLDVSGSMRWRVNRGDTKTPRRIDSLRPAAKNFITQIFSDDDAAENVSVSMIPFAGQVNMGRAMYQHLGIPRRHNYSSCVHFDDSDFGKNVPNFAKRDQVGHFTKYNYHEAPFNHSKDNAKWTADKSAGGKEWFTSVDDGNGPLIGEPWWCPDDPHGYGVGGYDITTWQNNKLSYDENGVLTNRKKNKDYTFKYKDIYYEGTEWEDQKFVLPAGQSIFIQEGGPDGDLHDHVTVCSSVSHPSKGNESSDDDDRVCEQVGNKATRKFGQAVNRQEVRIDGDRTTITYLSNNQDELTEVIDGLHLYDGTGTANGMLWAMTLLNPGFNPDFSSALEAGVVPTHPTGPARPKNFSERPAAFDDGRTEKFIVLMTDGQINEQRQLKDGGSTVSYHEERLKRRVSQDDVEKQFSRMCGIAKEEGVTVFTIGFALGSGDDNLRKLLTDCATSESHRFWANESDKLDNAFEAIAATIQKVRLTS